MKARESTKPTPSSWLAKLTPEQVLCRRYGHAWAYQYWYTMAAAARQPDAQWPWVPPETNTTGKDQIHVTRCARCATERHDQYDPTSFELVRRRYVYGESYLRPHDEPRPDARAIMAQVAQTMKAQKRTWPTPRETDA